MRLTHPALLRDACYINGQWRKLPQHLTVTDPATGDAIGNVPDAGESETLDAISAAEAALPAWRGLTAKARAGMLRRWYELILAHESDLAALLTAEQGKPLAEAVGEIRYAASFIEWAAEEGKRVYGEILPSPARGQKIFVMKEPVGIVAAITPWNFPSAMITRKAAPALAAGCTIVIKPAEQTPLSALALAALAEEAGIPAGVFNVVTGNPERIGAALTSDPRIHKLSFTGSTEIGRLLMQQCAGTVKKLSLELGGNAPFLIFADADLDAAVAGVMASKYRNAGQTCISANRIFIEESATAMLLPRLIAEVQALTVGKGCDANVQVGPLIDDAALRKAQELIADAVAHGAKIETGGTAHALGGTFFAPTLLSGCTEQMRLFREEIFGPVMPVFTFRDEAAALRMANATEYGLAAYFYTRDAARIWRVSEALEYGMVGVNEARISNEVAPFGGIKQSGYGREGGHWGVEEYLQTKYLCMGGL